MEPARAGIHERGKRIEIRALQLGKFAIVHEQDWKRVSLIREFLEH